MAETNLADDSCWRTDRLSMQGVPDCRHESLFDHAHENAVCEPQFVSQ